MTKHNNVICKLRKAYDIIQDVQDDAQELFYPSGKSLEEAKNYLREVIIKTQKDRDGQ